MSLTSYRAAPPRDPETVSFVANSDLIQAHESGCDIMPDNSLNAR
jgi:hypothetical protein